MAASIACWPAAIAGSVYAHKYRCLYSQPTRFSANVGKVKVLERRQSVDLIVRYLVFDVSPACRSTFTHGMTKYYESEAWMRCEPRTAPRCTPTMIGLYQPFCLEILSILLVLLPPKLLADRPPRVLLLGGGGGLIASTVCNLFPGATMDIAEPDLSVLEAARAWFGLDVPVQRLDGGSVHAGSNQSDSHGCARIVIANGLEYMRHHLAASRPLYDAIIVDAFGQDARGQIVFPAVFGLPEFARTASLLLERPHGLLAVNHYPDDPACKGLRSQASARFRKG